MIHWLQANFTRTEKLVLFGILMLATVLRVWGIGFGLPYIYHYDEQFYIHTSLNLGAGVLNNPPYTPTGLPNALFPGYASYYAIGKVLGDEQIDQRDFITMDDIMGDETAPPSDDEMASLIDRLTENIVEMGYSRRSAINKATKVINENPEVDNIDTLLELVIESM